MAISVQKFYFLLIQKKSKTEPEASKEWPRGVAFRGSSFIDCFTAGLATGFFSKWPRCPKETVLETVSKQETAFFLFRNGRNPENDKFMGNFFRFFF